MLYKLVFQIFPDLICTGLTKTKSGNSYYEKKDQYQYYNLVNRGYNYIKESCQQIIQSGEYKELNGKFSPLGLHLNMKVCRVIGKMGTPNCVISNSHIMKRHYTLFYKKRIGSMRCVFELHFHRKRLFLCQITVNEKGSNDDVNKVCVINKLLGDYIGEGFDLKKESETPHYFKDQDDNSICVHKDVFSTRFVFTNPYNDSLDRLLLAKHKRNKSSRQKEFELHDHIFVQA